MSIEPRLVEAPAPSPRIDTPVIARRLSANIQSKASRIAGMLGKNWTTESSLAEAKDLLVRLAHDALTLRLEL